MTVIDYGIMLAAVVVVALLSGASSLLFRNLQNRGAGNVVPPEPVSGKDEPQIHIEIPDPVAEMAKLPEPGDSSTLPAEAKSVLMNAVWYRCENPRCNYTQFLDVYHIVSAEKGGSNALDNLVVLCPECRTNAGAGVIEKDMLRSWTKGRIERFKFTIDWPYR